MKPKSDFPWTALAIRRIALPQALLALLALSALLPMPGCTARAASDADTNLFLKARVISVETIRDNTPVFDGFDHGFDVESELITVELTSAPYKGRVIRSTSIKSGNPAYDFDVKPGDRVVMWAEVHNGEIVEAHVFSPDRGRCLKWLVAGFMAALLLVGGLAGVKTLLTLGVTGLAIVYVLLPALIRGHDPIIVTVLVSTAVTIVTIAAVGGASKKTLTAIIGTTGGVLVAGLIALAVGSAARLTGFGTEEAAMLLYVPQGIQFDFRRLLFSGMIIGALGAVMDVAMSVASSMEEVTLARARITQSELLQSGLRVGRDVMGTMSNTLILAYTGGAIPLLLLFLAYGTPMIQIANFDHIATEVVKAFAGSIGLIAAVPITAIAGSRLLNPGK